MSTRRSQLLGVATLALLVSVAGFAQEAAEETETPDATPAVEAATPGPPSLAFETTVDFELMQRIAIDGRAGEIEFRGVEFSVASSKGGVFGTSDADLKAKISVRLDCSTAAEKKAKAELTVQFLDSDGALIDRATGGASLKAESKIVELDLTTLKYVAPLIKQVRISAIAK